MVFPDLGWFGVVDEDVLVVPKKLFRAEHALPCPSPLCRGCSRRRWYGYVVVCCRLCD
jgi:hypothetical protein